MMLDPTTVRRLTALVNALVTQTAAGRVRWHQSRSLTGQSIYTTATRSAFVEVTARPGEDQVLIAIQDKRGEDVEEYISRPPAQRDSDEFDELDQALDKLMIEVRRTPERVNAILDKVLDEITGTEPARGSKAA